MQSEDRDLETGSHYLSRAVARSAIALAAPMIERALGDATIVGSGFLYMVVMDPTFTPANATFEEAILYEHSFGDRSRWDADYAGFARAKARLSWLTGCDGHTVQQDRPYLLRPGDTLNAGGVWLDGLVVAASGAFAEFDEAFSGSVALLLKALVRKARMSEAIDRQWI